MEKPDPGFDVHLAVKLVPGAKVEAVEGVQGGMLKVRVRQPPLDGRANEACLRLLSDWLDVPRSRVELVRGAADRRKLFRVRGCSAETLRRLRLAGYEPGERGRQ